MKSYHNIIDICIRVTGALTHEQTIISIQFTLKKILKHEHTNLRKTGVLTRLTYNLQSQKEEHFNSHNTNPNTPAVGN